jgi:hypothetical protein
LLAIRVDVWVCVVSWAQLFIPCRRFGVINLTLGLLAFDLKKVSLPMKMKSGLLFLKKLKHVYNRTTTIIKFISFANVTFLESQFINF